MCLFKNIARENAVVYFAAERVRGRRHRSLRLRSKAGGEGERGAARFIPVVYSGG